MPLTNLFIILHNVIRYPIHNITALKFRGYNKKSKFNFKYHSKDKYRYFKLTNKTKLKKL